MASPQGTAAVFLANVTITALRDDAGTLRGFAKVTRDLTGRLVADTQRQFLGDLMPQIIWISSPDGEFQYFNKRWFDYTGLTFDQSRNSGWKIVVHPDDLAECGRAWADALASGKSHEGKFRYRCATDHHVPLAPDPGGPAPGSVRRDRRMGGHVHRHSRTKAAGKSADPDRC